MSDTNTVSPEALVETYCRAWSEPDADARQALLDEAWDEGGVYTDPMAVVAGRAALHTHIGAAFNDFPGMVISATSAVDMHHDMARFTWQLSLPDGSVPVAGTDFAHLTPDGKIRSLTGFFGPLPSRA